MTEHVCEFKPLLAECECGRALTIAELCKRANATERLRAGIDELKDACKDDPNEMGGPFVSLSWVERTLEGK